MTPQPSIHLAQEPASDSQPSAWLRQARAWLESRERIEAEQQRQALIALLESFTEKPHYETDEIDCVRELERAWSPTMSELQRNFRRSPGMVTHDAPAFHHEMAKVSYGYARIYRSFALTETRRPGTEHSDALRRECVGLALFYLGKHAKFTLARNAPLASEFWQELHGLYALAVDHGFAAEPMPTASGSDFSGNCEQLWLRPLMLATLGGSGLSPRQIYRAEGWLQRWCAQISVDRSYDASVHVYCVNIKTARGAQRIASALDDTSLLYLGTSRLYQDISVARARLIENTNKSSLGLYAENPLREYFELLERLQRIWLSAPSMQSRRTDQRVVAADIEDADVVRHVENVFAVLAAPSVENPVIETMTVVDRSHSGFGLLARSDHPPTVRELIAVRAASNLEWKIGVIVRIATAPGDRAYQIGVQLLSQIAIPVSLCRITQKPAKVRDGGVTSQIQAFYMIGDPSFNRADGVLATQLVCAPGDKFKLKTATDEFVIQINRIVESGIGWERFGFQVVQKVISH